MGYREKTLLFTVATTLERNRLVNVTKSTGIAAYATYGSQPDGILSDRSDDSDRCNVIPIDQLYRSFMLSAAAAITKGAAVFCTANGQIVASSGTVTSRNVLTAPAGTEGDIYIVPASAAGGWSTATAVGQLMVKGASTWNAGVDVAAGTVYFVSDEQKYYITSAQNTWTIAKIVCYANETATVAGEEIECYNLWARQRVTPEQMPQGLNWMIITAGQITIADNATSGTFTDDRILSTDLAIVSSGNVATTAQAPLSGVCTADTVTVTCTDPGSSGLIVNLIVIRPIA